MANLGRALMAGLVAGGAKYADMKLDEKDKAAQAEREQELMKLQQRVMEANERFKASLKAPDYQTIKDTGPDGQMRERTIRSSYDPEAMGFTETEVGSAILPDKQERAETDAEFFARDPAAFREYKSAGRAPRGDGSGGKVNSEKLTFDEYRSLDEATRKAYDKFTGRAESKDASAEIRQKIAAERQDAIARFDQMDNRERTALLKSVGIDPESPNARTNYANKIRDDYKTQLGVDLFEGSVKSGTRTTTEAGGMGDAPAPASPKKDAPYPEGTKLKGPDGKLYIVKNGQPVLYGG